MSTSKHKIGEAGISLLLRLPSDGTAIEKVAEAHNSVILKNGSVWLGIVGKTYSTENICRLRENCGFLYLAQNRSAGISVYRGKISDISQSVPAPQRSLIPTYYGDLGIEYRAKLWVKLSSLSPTSTQEIDGLRVVSSGKDASVLLRGMAYLGMVERK